jgi:hypothetical protein
MAATSPGWRIATRCTEARLVISAA